MLECSSLRARSSMVEQWPFKPFVESSSLSALTEKPSSWKVFLFHSTEEIITSGVVLIIKVLLDLLQKSCDFEILDASNEIEV